MHVYEHKIELTAPKTVVRRSYPLPLHQKAAVNKEIERVLEMGIIERSTSEFCNPLRVVTKKDGSDRLCLNARFLNKIIASANESPPRVKELTQKHEGAEYLSTRKYTAFLHAGKLYQFKVNPFGVRTAGAGFIHALDTALDVDGELRNFISKRIGDLLITSRTFDDHLEHLHRLFDC